MNAVLLNGSPRKGNTYAALEALKKGLSHIENLQIRQIDAADVAVSPCMACQCCMESGLCVYDDDSNAVIDAIEDADILIFATPVYWWGMTAQLKLIIDKFYCRQPALKSRKKNVGVISIGQMPADNVQYRLIGDQLRCISDFLGWEVAFTKAYSAYDIGDLAADARAMAEIEGLWKEFHL